MLKNLFIFILLASLVELLGHIYLFPKWQSREMPMPQINRRSYSLITIVTSSVFGEIFSLLYKNIFVGFSITLFVWLACIVIATDLKYRKIPSGACWLVLILNSIMNVIFIIKYHNYLPLFSEGITVLSILFTAAILVLLTKGEFGSGDVRLMLAIGSLAGSFGYAPILLGIAISSVIQLPLRIWLKKFGKYEGVGLPFAPALIIGTLLSITFLSHPGGSLL